MTVFWPFLVFHLAQRRGFSQKCQKKSGILAPKNDTFWDPIFSSGRIPTNTGDARKEDVGPVNSGPKWVKMGVKIE